MLLERRDRSVKVCKSSCAMRFDLSYLQTSINLVPGTRAIAGNIDDLDQTQPTRKLYLHYQPQRINLPLYRRLSYQMYRFTY